MARKKSEMAGAAEEAVSQEKVQSDSVLEGLKAALAKRNAVFGSRSVLKALKTKSLKAVFVASNCPESVKNDISSHAKISGAKLENFAGTAKQMGIFCGKPFAVASLAVMEEKKK